MEIIKIKSLVLDIWKLLIDIFLSFSAWLIVTFNDCF